ncbi:MAG: hypothetical protein Q9224_007301, partial [Gallowayella concinna]
MTDSDGFFIRDDRDPEHVSYIMDLQIADPPGSIRKDTFGKDIVPPQPLTFDRVSEGRLPVSDSRLLHLPTEILALVVEAIPQHSLASFALVNSDCRQLARSRQFASVLLDYGHHSWQLIQQLGREVKERVFHSTHGRTKKPAIGPCIRRITVATSPGWLHKYHGMVLEGLPEAERTTRLTAA